MSQKYVVQFSAVELSVATLAILGAFYQFICVAWNRFCHRVGFRNIDFWVFALTTTDFLVNIMTIILNLDDLYVLNVPRNAWENIQVSTKVISSHLVLGIAFLQYKIIMESIKFHLSRSLFISLLLYPWLLGAMVIIAQTLYVGETRISQLISHTIVSTVLCYLPFSLMVLLYGKSMLRLREYDVEFMNASTGTVVRESKTIFQYLIVITILFLVCHLPYTISIYLWWTISSTDVEHQGEVLLFVRIGFFLLSANSLVNLVVYSKVWRHAAQRNRSVHQSQSRNDLTRTVGHPASLGLGETPYFTSVNTI